MPMNPFHHGVPFACVAVAVAHLAGCKHEQREPSEQEMMAAAQASPDEVRMHGEEMIPALRACVLRLRHATCAAKLGEIGTEDAKEAISEVLGELESLAYRPGGRLGYQNQVLLRSLLAAAGRHRIEKTVPVLERFAKSADGMCRVWATWALREIHPTDEPNPRPVMFD